MWYLKWYEHKHKVTPTTEIIYIISDEMLSFFVT